MTDPDPARAPVAKARRPAKRRVTKGKRRRTVADRATRMTPETCALIVQHIANGVPKEDAARAAGVNPSTFFRRQARDARFARQVARAEDELKPKLYAVIQSAALAGDWRAAVALGRAKWPHEFAPPTRVQHAGDPENPTPIPIDAGAELRDLARRFAGMTTDELRAFAPRRRAAEDIAG